jgi:predicted nucleic acid-binding protein
MAFLARIECRSAVERLVREGKLNAATRRRVLAKLDTLLAAFDIVAFSADVETDALALLGSHPLRSLDALQLSCARRLKGDGDGVVELACCDRKLAEAAAADGFSLIVRL